MSNARDLGNITTVGFTNDITISARDLNFADNDKINFGAANDLQLYHDGSASYIVDTGTGSLFVQGENLYLQNTADANYLQALNNGEVNLNYAGSKKIATTATGVSVTGDVSSSTVTLIG